MAIPAVGNTNTPTSTTPTKSPNTLDKNAFLKLFTEQLKNQDPLKPMDATAFTAQMAQFSALEQQVNTNDNLKTLIASQNSILAGMSANLIGKTVTLQDGSTGKVSAISFEGNTTTLMLDNNKKVLLSEVKQITA